MTETLDRTRRNTAKVQRYRKRLMATKNDLVAQVQRLQSLIRVHSLTAPLGWDDICNALASGTEEAQAENRALKAQRYELDQVIEAMTKWVMSMSRPSLQTMLPEPLGWSRTSLSADRTSRKLGFDWYTQHLRSNTGRFFMQCSFPATGLANHLNILENDDDTFHFVWSYQREYALSVDEVYKGIRLPIWRKLRSDTSAFPIQMLDQELLDDIATGKMMYRRVVISEKRTDVLLTREFNEPDGRVIFVSGNIHEDALLPESHYLRNRMFWHVLEPLGPHRTRLRVAWTISSFLSNNKPVTWEEEAAVLKRDIGVGSSEVRKRRYKELCHRDMTMRDSAWADLFAFEYSSDAQ
ncbi:hypothetical protein ACHHYP_02023 [Achlya hypogyna]|uniref:Uncharacterized protein n=1 Tax=Achlya hypogyna TaxID=1202772 RepID=A0A1V9ZSH3_ACHHY|nr:hypothetical protein ACHHYP_02023 [Achlya hypogyna]